MKILVPALRSDKPMLRKMLNTYLVELSQYAATDLEYPYLDTYWREDQNRWPYLIRSKNQTVGFVLVNTWSPSGQGTEFAVAEFYIIPNARQNGLGQKAAREVFVGHTGQWELGVVNANTGAHEFWDRILAQTSATRIVRDTETIFRFRT